MAIKEFIRKAVGNIPGGQLITEGLFGGKDARLIPMPSLLPTTQRTQINEVTSGWFTPLQPMTPFSPGAQSAPRQFAYMPGSNILYQPKTGEADGQPGVSYDVLRLFADSWDILRLVIETAKDRIMRVPWNIHVRREEGETTKDFELRNKEDKTLRDIRAFYRKPDGRHNFKKWMRMWLEDMFVIDAVAIYAARDKKKRIAAFRPYDGATFNRLLTDEGLSPQAPDPAYQQVLYGIVSGNFSTDDLLYSMRNERTCRRYGYSKVEQVIISINLGLRRLEWMLQEYTSGNVPEALVFMPVGGDTGITVDDVKRAQEDFNTMMQGNLANRRQMRFLPSFNTSGGAPPIVFPKEPLLKDPLDEWLAKIVLFDFGMSGQYFEKQMNRATAGQAQETAEEEGLLPDLEESKMILDTMLEMQGFGDEYEWGYERARETDPLKQAQADSMRVKSFLNTPNEIRKANGDDPDPNPLADKLITITPSGAVELGQVVQAAGAFGGGPTGEGGKPPAKEGKPEEKAPAKPKAAEKIAKKATRRHILQAGTLTPESEEARKKIVATLSESFGRMKTIAAKKAKSLVKATQADDVVEAIMAALKEEFDALPEALRGQLEASALSGVTSASLDINADESLIASSNEAAVAFAENRASELIGMHYVDGVLEPQTNPKWAITESTREDLRTIITRAFESDEAPIENIQTQIEEAASFSEYRAEMVARTEISRAQVHGVMECWEQSGLVKTYVWLQSEDEDVCEICEAMADGGPYEFGSGPVPIDDSHPNCLIGSTIVSTDFPAVAFTRRWFEGEVVTITCFDGTYLTLTPNHPVLTLDGWIAAGEISENSYLFKGRGQDKVVSHPFVLKPDNKLMPSVIEKVFSSLLESGGMSSVRMPSSAEDFHGDGMADREIDIVRTDSLLSYMIDSGIEKKSRKNNFPAAHSGRFILDGKSAQAQCLKIGLTSSASSMSSESSDQAIFSTEALVAEAHNLMHGSNRKTSLLKPSGQSTSLDSDASSDNRETFSIDISLMQVSKIERSIFSGHVYNLQTVNGYYFANGIIAHNCRCIIAADVIEGEDELAAAARTGGVRALAAIMRKRAKTDACGHHK